MIQDFPLQVRVLVLACLRKHEKHYAFGITRWIQKHCEVPATIPQVFRECDSLRRRGYLDSTEGAANDKDAGPNKVYYALNPKGLLHVKEERERLQRGGIAMEKVIKLLED